MTASPPTAPGMPSEETIREIVGDALNSAIAEPWEVSAHATQRILSLIHAAFEAKDAEIERLKALPVIADYIEVQDARRAAEAKLAQAVEALENATAFDLGDDIVVESRGKGTWAVKNFDSVLNADGVWEWEPQPSSRGDDFIARTRFSRDEAFDRARSASAAARGEA